MRRAASSIFGLVVCAWMVRGVFLRDDGYPHCTRTQHSFAVLISIVAVGTLLLAGTADGLSPKVLRPHDGDVLVRARHEHQTIGNGSPRH